MPLRHEMAEYSWLDWVRGCSQYVVITIMGWVYMAHQKVMTRVDGMESRIHSLEINVEIVKVVLNNFKEDLAEIKSDLKQVLENTNSSKRD